MKKAHSAGLLLSHFLIITLRKAQVPFTGRPLVSSLPHSQVNLEEIRLHGIEGSQTP